MLGKKIIYVMTVKISILKAAEGCLLNSDYIHKENS